MQFKQNSQLFNTIRITKMYQVHNGLIQVKEEGWTGFSEGWQGCSEGFPKGEARENLDSFTWIYILIEIGHFGDISDFFSNIDV